MNTRRQPVSYTTTEATYLTTDVIADRHVDRDLTRWDGATPQPPEVDAPEAPEDDPDA